MKKILLTLLFIMVCSSLFSAVTVKDFFGKVKVKYDGDTTWSKIEIGQELPANTLVSTGFNSQIVLDLGNATLDVLPLTRMTLSEITESNDTIKTSLFLKGGKIKADVGKIEGKLNDFKIKSPVATASVRGTAFEFSGNKLKVLRGTVAMTPTKKETADQPGSEEGDSDDGEDDDSGVAVKAGGESQMSSPGSSPVSPSAMAKNSRTVSASTKPVVVKNAVASMGGSVVQEVLSGADIQSIIEEASDTGIANITITINAVVD